MELPMDSTSIPSEGFFQDGDGIEMSQSVLQKLQEMKELNHKEELKKQKYDLPLNRYIKPRTYLERYETSLLEDLSFIDPRKALMKPNNKPLPSRYFNHSGNNDEEEENLERLNTINEQASIESVGYSSDDNKENKEAISEVDNAYGYDEEDEEIENSFEKSSSSAINLDDMPVKNIVQGGKTFEEVIEEQLLKEQQRKDALSLVNKVPTPKKSFLRKGQGTARFNGPPIKVTRRKPAKKVGGDGKAVKIGAPKPELKLKLERKDKIIKPAIEENITKPVEEKVTKPVEEKPLPALSNNVIPTNKLPIRKTARLRREPIKKLTLLPLQTSTKVNNETAVGRHPVIQRSLAPSPTFDQPKSVVDSQEKERENTTPVPPPAQEEKAPVGNDYNDEEEWSDPNDDTVLTLETTELENLLKVPSDPNQTSNETFERIERYCNENFDGDDMPSFDLDDTIKLRPGVQGAVAASNIKQQAEEPSNLLMQKLFPSLKPPPPPAITKKQVEKKPFQPEYYADPDQPKPESGAILKSKLEELQAEIKRFQKENDTMVKSRAEHENGVEELRKQVEEFQKLKNEELSNIDQYRKSERAKLKKDRRMFEDYVSTTKKNLPSKEDKETIRELEEELEQVRAEAKLKEQRLAAVNSRLRTQLDMLSSENTELKNQLQSLEERNINLQREAERRKAKESNRIWKEINEIVDNSTSFNVPNSTSKVEVVECNLPVARYVTSPTKQDSSSPKTTRKTSREPPRNNSKNAAAAAKVVRCVSHDKKRETQLEDGSTEIIYCNDTRKVISADGKTIEVTFSNGDVRTTLPDGAETYFYKASGARRTTQADGVQVIEFDNQQVERLFIDGSKHITFPDGSSKLVRQDGYEETTVQDGTCMRLHPNGEKTIDFPNGQREIHTSDFKRREYPDGTSKTVFSDGRQETKYASGRLRVKDPSGRVVIDSMLPQTSTTNQVR